VLADHRDRLEGTGYTIGDTARPEPEPDPDPDPEPTGFEPITQAGDLWQIGPHSLICGSSADLATITEMLGTRRVNLAVTSPPYADRRDYDPSSGFRPIPPDEYVTWFAPIAANVAAVLTPDGSWVVNIKPGSDGLDRELYVFDLVLAHARDWGWHFAEEYCWERGGVPRTPSRRLRNGFEPVFQFTRGEWKWRPDHVRHHSDHVPVPVGSGGKAAGGMGSTAKLQGVQGEEWFADRNEPGLAYPNNRLPTFSGSHEATGHNAAYPIGLPQFFVELLTDPGDLVLDPFSGSGSTILAAHRTDRVGVGVELSPAYVDVALARIQHHTGLTPTRAGEPHDLLAHTGWRPTRERGTDG
jgi:DNA modification methylase